MVYCKTLALDELLSKQYFNHVWVLNQLSWNQGFCSSDSLADLCSRIAEQKENISEVVVSFFSNQLSLVCAASGTEDNSILTYVDSKLLSLAESVESVFRLTARELFAVSKEIPKFQYPLGTVQSAIDELHMTFIQREQDPVEHLVSIVPALNNGSRALVSGQILVISAEVMQANIKYVLTLLEQQEMFFNILARVCPHDDLDESMYLLESSFEIVRKYYLSLIKELDVFAVSVRDKLGFI